MACGYFIRRVGAAISYAALARGYWLSANTPCAFMFIYDYIHLLRVFGNDVEFACRRFWECLEILTDMALKHEYDNEGV